MAKGITLARKLYNGELVRYFRITGWPEVGVGVAYQVPLPTCLKFFVILTNEKAKVTYQTFIKELSNPPRIDTVVILQHTRPNEGRDICTTIAFIHGLGKSMACIKFFERFIYGFSGAMALFNSLDLNCVRPTPTTI